MNGRGQSLILLLIYFSVKFIAYSAWCYFGKRWINPNFDEDEWHSLFLGLIRAVIGVGFGLLVGYVTKTTPAIANVVRIDYSTLVGYVAVLLPIRWLEWSLMSLFKPLKVKGWWLLPWNDRRAVVWRVGGIGISFAADVPAFLFALPYLVC